jgi:hypothetical protein
MKKLLLIGMVILNFSSKAEATFNDKNITNALIMAVNYNKIRLAQKGEFKIYFINRYKFELRDIILDIETNKFYVSIKPHSLTLPPSGTGFFTITLKLKEVYPEDEYLINPVIKITTPKQLLPNKQLSLIEDSEATATMKKYYGLPENDNMVFNKLSSIEIIIDKYLNFKLTAYLAFLVGLILFLIFKRKP